MKRSPALKTLEMNRQQNQNKKQDIHGKEKETLPKNYFQGEKDTWCRNVMTKFESHITLTL